MAQKMANLLLDADHPDRLDSLAKIRDSVDACLVRFAEERYLHKAKSEFITLVR